MINLAALLNTEVRTRVTAPNGDVYLVPSAILHVCEKVPKREEPFDMSKVVHIIVTFMHAMVWNSERVGKPDEDVTAETYGKLDFTDKEKEFLFNEGIELGPQCCRPGGEHFRSEHFRRIKLVPGMPYKSIARKYNEEYNKRYPNGY